MRSRVWLTRFAGLFAAACALGGVQTAASQEATTTQVDLPKFNPAVAGDRFFGVPSPFAAGPHTFHAIAMLDYANKPLVLVRDVDGSTEDIGPVVSDQMFVHLGVNFAIADYVAINASMPFAVLSSGDAPSGGGLNFAAPSGAAVGDLRVGARVRLIGEYHDPFQLGVGGYVWIPTGSDTSYVSDGSVRGQPQLLVGGKSDWFIWSVMAGPSFRSPTNLSTVQIGHQMNWGAGVGVQLLEQKILQFGVEAAGGVDIETPDGRTTNAEVLASTKLRIPGAEFLETGLAIGPGLTTGIGTPAFRGVFSFAYTPVIEEPKGDTDGDGILDDVDACVKVPGVKSDDPAKHGCPPDADTDKDGILDKDDACVDVPGPRNDDPKKHGCPPPGDKDGDGILDPADACVDVPGIPNEDPQKNGCPPPPDKDGDGVLDADDACVDIPGIKTEDKATNGCPGDTDGDGIRDDKDACPREKGEADPDPSKTGCPKLVRVTDQEIVILEQVQFDTGKATIRPVSNPLLDSVAQVLKEHPEILKLEVQGHTDNKGAKALNEKLSKDRAKSVMEALIKRGIAKERLTSQGYGMDKPIADNKDEAGRQKNRRVQFIVLEKAEKAGGKPTTVQTK
jgi:OmpA-OmpF porin, OOP family